MSGRRLAVPYYDEDHTPGLDHIIGPQIAANHKVRQSQYPPRHRAEPSSSRPIHVTVAVDTDDIQDTLTWMSGTAIKSESTNRWLSAYMETEGEQRELIFGAMPASLQWCVHEYENRGAGALRAVLEPHSIHEGDPKA